ncbi:MAG: UDP-glucose 4-epimerase GalE [Patescibacteria group bacterium]|nr:UDP-glucose 4-epimerase GalE [Patescibacteria group bacterium]
MQIILVTGGGGYIGSHAVKRLLKENYSVVVFDNFSRGFREPLEILNKYGELNIVEGDLLKEEDIKKVFKKYKIDAVMHFAALCLVDESTKKPELYFKNNVIGTLNLVEAMNEAGVKKIILSSTCAVYGDAEYLPIDERHITKPTNPYGESKLMAEKIIHWFNITYKFNYAILRYFNVCGADSDGEIGDSKKPSELLMQNAVRGALGIEDFKLTCPKVDTLDGTPIRDYVDVEDIIDAHMKALYYLKDNNSLICNLGNGHGISVKEIIRSVQKELDVNFQIHFSNTRMGEYVEVYANNSVAKDLLKWTPNKTLKDSIKSLVVWYSHYPKGYKF